MASIQVSARKAKAGIVLLSLFMLLTIILAGCGNGGGATNTVHHKNSVTLVANQAGDLVRNFNPFSGNVITGTPGLIYETLLFFNRTDDTVHPWLASSYEFSANATQLLFHLRTDVKWSDGQQFTSADVKFTLDELVKYNDLDIQGIAGYIKSVTTPDQFTVQITLNQAWSPILWYLGGQTWIVSQHEWAAVSGDPGKFADPNPIGTGPYTVGTFTPQLLVLNKNKNFWQPGKPAVAQVRFPAFSSNESSELVLNTNGIDWNSQYSPNIQKTYVDRDPTHHHYWFSPSDVVFLYLNLSKAPFNNLAVRQAISAAINRDRLYKVSESGYEPVTSPTGLVLPASQSYLDPQYTSLKFTQNASQAASELQSAGFTKGTDGFYRDKSGKKISFTINVPEGYSDWITSCQFMADDLKAIGLDVSVNTLSYDTYYNAMQVGSFDTSMWGTNPGPSPFYIYDSLLRSANSAALGQQAGSNFERWLDPATDKLLAQYSTSNDPALQKQAIYGLEKIMIEQLPSIPLVNEPYWYEYNTEYWVGWPDQAHQYAEPSPYAYPDNEVVLLHLQPS
ncbi:MAG TPA: ABC transporter substrate-binding protein [Ktedonobacteraceae bacterium]